MSKYKPRYTNNREMDVVVKDIYDILNQISAGSTIISRTNVASSSGGSQSGVTYTITKTFAFGDFGTVDNLIYTVSGGYILEKIIIVVDTAFDEGTITVKDSLTLAPPDESDLTIEDSYTFNKYKKYTTTTQIKADYTGTPTVGGGIIILKVTKI